MSSNEVFDHDDGVEPNQVVELNGIERARPAVFDREDTLRWVGLI
jgi:hypothetical protein